MEQTTANPQSKTTSAGAEATPVPPTAGASVSLVPSPNLLSPLIENLDALNIHYTWDPEFEDEGLLVINSKQHIGKHHYIGMTINKTTGALVEIEFEYAALRVYEYCYGRLPQEAIEEIMEYEPGSPEQLTVVKSVAKSIQS